MHFLLLVCLAAGMDEPNQKVWLQNSSLSGTPALAAVRPEVHSVAVNDKYIEVKSAGISLFDLGPFQIPPRVPGQVRKFQFRIPRYPRLAADGGTYVRPDVVGVFVNGSPIYNHWYADSFEGRNLWHFDSIAGNDDGSWTARGRPRAEMEHGFSPGLLQKLIADSSGHSPILGYAFDGFPIYGPWGYAGAGQVLKRMRSSYQLRKMTKRHDWPDGTALSAGQFGPDVEAFPLGSFVEDYEFVPGSGDLDRHNGRFAKTPEYPEGTYAYFMSSDEPGKLSYPYLVGERYRGQVSEDQLEEAMIDLNLRREGVSGGKILADGEQDGVAWEARGSASRVAEVIDFRFQSTKGIRSLEHVHERPIHLIIISKDLGSFDHIHPELVGGSLYRVVHRFPAAGEYRVFADFTLPGEAQRIVHFDVVVSGEKQKPRLSSREETTRLEMRAEGDLIAGLDSRLLVSIKDRAGIERYLGSWGHFIVTDESLDHFIHAHPIDLDASGKSIATAHVHGVIESGPVPEQMSVLLNFPHAGVFRVWGQIQRNGRVETYPFQMRVEGDVRQRSSKLAEVPEGALRLHVGSSGFTPGALHVPAKQEIHLAITRDSKGNCGNRIVFPSLGVAKDLPLGETTIWKLPMMDAGEVRFSCGMGMYRGAVVVK